MANSLIEEEKTCDQEGVTVGIHNGNQAVSTKNRKNK